MMKVYNLSKYFQRKLASTMLGGKDYILQKEDGTLLVDGVTLDRDELNAMQSWQDMVDMGVSKSTVGKIALEYGGKPQNVDVWLEQNSTPYKSKIDSDQTDKKDSFEIARKLYDLWNPEKGVYKLKDKAYINYPINEIDYEFWVYPTPGDNTMINFAANPSFDEEDIMLEDSVNIVKVITDSDFNSYLDAVEEILDMVYETPLQKNL